MPKRVRMLRDTRADFGMAQEGREYPVSDAIAKRWEDMGRAEVIGDTEEDEGVSLTQGAANVAERRQIREQSGVDPNTPASEGNRAAAQGNPPQVANTGGESGTTRPS